MAMPEASDFTALVLAIGLGPVLFFLIGSIPFGYLIGRLRGIDLRQKGSGNIGATNVGRVMGSKWATVVFVLDFLKGFLPLFILNNLSTGWMNALSPLAVFLRRICDCPATETPVGMLAILGLLLVAGHNYTPWLRFKGGKGIATSAGALAALAPLVLTIALSLWIVVVLASRWVSLASLAACFALPISALLFYPGQNALFLFTFIMALSGVWRHRANINRLYLGTEPRVGKAS
jgi:acyl phosphate:glycerol-3-phosphate acyltransferase